MKELCDWLATLTKTEGDKNISPVLAAAIAHTWFVIIHPFTDGNGRTARILMNLVLLRSGFPISIITHDDRYRYYDSLEEAQSGDLSSFLNLVCETIEETIEEYQYAMEQQVTRTEWALSLVSRLNQQEQRKQEVEFEIWRNAMGLLKGLFAEIAETMNSLQAVPLGSISLKEYGESDFEKYLMLSQGRTAKKTWFFGIQIRSGKTSERFVFWFTRSSPAIRMRTKSVAPSLTISISEKTQYMTIENAAKDVTHRLYTQNKLLCEIAYSREAEMFAVRYSDNSVDIMKADAFVMTFYENIVSLLF